MNKMIQGLRAVTLSAVAAVMAGCATGYSTYGGKVAVNPASTVQINGEFDIPNQSARVYFQGGEQVGWGEIDRWTTYCSVLVNNVQYADQPQQTVGPGDFSIVKVRQSNDRYQNARVFVASRDGFFDIPSNVTYKVEMRLNSAEQPDVRSLICAKRVDQIGFGRNHYPKLAEMRTALGDLVEINSPG